MQCLTPLNLRDPKINQSFPIPCGKCPVCVQKRASGWGFRLRKEADVSTSALFLTLTYNSDSVPITPRGFMTLRPNDITLWLKRLRKRSKNKLKYFYVGEYGGKTQRPHYHMLLFNADIQDIEDTYNYGAVHYGAVSGASVGYCMKYMVKDGLIPAHQNDDRLPEFARMSKGLGASYLSEEVVNYHRDPRALLERLSMVIDEKHVAMPRYYKDKIYTDEDKRVIKHYAAQRLDECLNIDEHERVEAHAAMFRKMYKDKYKGKFI